MKKLMSGFMLLICVSVFAAEQPLRFGPYDSGWYPDGTNAVYLTGVHKVSPSVDMNMGLFIAAAVRHVYEVPVYAHLMFSTADIEVEGVGRTSGAGDMQLVVSPRIVYWDSGHINIGASVTAPTGSYHKDSWLNIGDNRWSFSPLIAVAQRAGQFHFEIWGGYDYYTDNDNYLHFLGEGTLEKDGNFFAELHTTYNIPPANSTYFTLSIGGIWGGEERFKASGISARAQKDMADYACKATVTTKLTAVFSVSVVYTYDLHVENGEKGYSVATKLITLF
jgi:hypothetical protein